MSTVVDARRSAGGSSPDAATRARRFGAVVFGLHVNGLGVFQHMVRQGIPVIGLDDRPGQPGFASRYGAKHVCPNPEREPEALLAFLQRLAAETPWRGVLFPTNDEFVLFISRYQALLEKDWEFALASPEVLETLNHKWLFHRLVERHGIPVPRTFCPESADELANIARDLAFPALLKPVKTSMWKGTGRGKVFLAGRPGELLDGYRRLSAGPGDLVAQELVPGGDDQVYFYFAYYDRRSEPVVEFTARKIRQYPPGFGTTCLAESVWVPEMAERSRRLLSGLGYQGLVDVEFKRDERDGGFRIIEVNPRLGLQHQLAAGAGADLTVAAFEDLTGAPRRPAATPAFREGVKWMIVDRDLESACLGVRAGRLTPREWLRSIRGRQVWAVWDRRDLRPFLGLLRLRTLACAAYLLAGAALSLFTPRRAGAARATDAGARGGH
jgi:predicted ATP-grasp superfamily ATP-dependent carboligase